MSGHYPWPKDPEGYSQERPTASEKHQALNAAAGPGKPTPTRARSFWPDKSNVGLFTQLLKAGRRIKVQP